MDEIKLDTKKTIKVSRKKFAVVVVIILVILFITAVSSLSTYRVMDEAAPNISSQDNYLLLESNKSIGGTPSMPYDYYRGYEQPSITDTREFLKTSYSAAIKTRDVSGVVKEVKNIVKGADGRIDNLYSSEKRGQVSFIVAKSKFDALKDEIEAITNKKLYSESISSQNLLSQKQSIEEQTNYIMDALSNLNKQKESLATKHNQTLNSINNELARIQSELVKVRANIANITDPQAILALRNQETTLVNEDALQRQKLSAENNNYSSQKQNLENQITNYNNNLTSINKQDSQFTDNIETVNGYVSVNWISLWQLAKIFSPISPVIIIIILIILAWIYLKHSRVVPKIEWY